MLPAQHCHASLFMAARRTVTFMALQILAGDEIESTFGARLGLSTLAAAGLGNLLSDLVGLAMAEPVQARLCANMASLRAPALAAPVQPEMHLLTAVDDCRTVLDAGWASKACPPCNDRCGRPEVQIVPVLYWGTSGCSTIMTTC